MDMVPNPRTTTGPALLAWLESNPTHAALVAYLWANDPNGEYDGDEVHPAVTTVEAREIITSWAVEM